MVGMIASVLGARPTSSPFGFATAVRHLLALGDETSTSDAGHSKPSMDVDAEGVFSGERHHYVAGWLVIDVDRELVEIGEEAGGPSGVYPAASLTNNEDVPDFHPP
jgi:hypothetical protein